MALVTTKWAFVKELMLVKLGISATIAEEVKLTYREKAAVAEPIIGKDSPASFVRYFLVRSIEKGAAG